MLSLKTGMSETLEQVAGKALRAAEPRLESAPAAELDPLIDALNRALYRKSSRAASAGRDEAPAT